MVLAAATLPVRVEALDVPRAVFAIDQFLARVESLTPPAASGYIEIGGHSRLHAVLWTPRR